MRVCVCVCQASVERIKETDGQNLSNVVSDFIHSRWREGGERRTRREEDDARRREGWNKSSLPRTDPARVAPVTALR